MQIAYTVHSVGLGVQEVEATLPNGKKVPHEEKVCVVELVPEDEDGAFSAHGTVKLILPLSFFQELEIGTPVTGSFEFPVNPVEE